MVRHLLTGCATCRAALATYAHLLFPRRPSDVPGRTSREPCAAGDREASRTPPLAARTISLLTACSHTSPTGLLAAVQEASGAPGSPQTPTALASPQAPATRVIAEKPPPSEEATAMSEMPEMPDTGAAPAIDAAYERAIDRALASVVRYGTEATRESKRVKQVLAVLERKGVAGFCEMPAHLRGLAGYEALLERSWSLRFDDPRQMVQLCELASVVAAGLSPSRYGGERVRDFQCRAAIELANAYRVIGRPAEAQAALNEALEFFRMGTQDRL
ncbi:MAG TPA: hypothetical protein VN999_07610, partial [Thermoanaerobaculia bacterium]|nr:hypothetical protein [Thermoanaerobaculia bacterium]